MTEKELIYWFEEKIHYCYLIVRDNHDVIWIYDKNYVRKLKLAEIDVVDEIVPPTYDKNKVMFYQQQNNWFLCDYDKIWSFLEDNYSPNFDDVQLFIKNRLDSIQNLKQLTPIDDFLNIIII